MCGERSDDDGCGSEEKERKTESEVDGQCKCGLEGDGTVGGGDAKPRCVGANHQTHRSYKDMRKDAVEEEDECV